MIPTLSHVLEYIQNNFEFAGAHFVAPAVAPADVPAGVPVDVPVDLPADAPVDVPAFPGEVVVLHVPLNDLPDGVGPFLEPVVEL
jgi:hypothetical protein